MAYRHFPITTPLTIVWHFSKPDGTTFSLDGYNYRLYYRNGNRETEAESTMLSHGGNLLSFVYPADAPRFEGAYSLRLDVFSGADKFITINYQNAFVLSRLTDSETPEEFEDTEPQSETVHLFTVAQYALLQPIIPTVGADGYWYVDGVPVVDGGGNYVTAEHTIRYDSSTHNIIIDEGRTDPAGVSIEQTITGISDYLQYWNGQYETAEAARNTAYGTAEGSRTGSIAGDGSRWGDYKAAEAQRNSDYSTAEGQRNTSYGNAENAREGLYNTAEAGRDNRAAAAEGTKNGSVAGDGSRWGEYKSQEAQRNSDYGTAEQSRNSQYNTAEGNRNTAYSGAEGARDGLYDTAEQGRDSRYNTAEGGRDTSYNSAEGNRNSQYSAAEGQRNSDYSTAEAARDTRYAGAEGSKNGSVAGDGSRWGTFKTNEAARDQEVQEAISHFDETKADKVQGGTENNFASLDANGNLKDSGHKHGDYLVISTKYGASINLTIDDQYHAVADPTGKNPASEGWFERSGTDPNYVYTKTTDSTPVSGKTYYTAPTYVLTAQLKDQDGNNLGNAKTIDLPLESVVVSGRYDSNTKKIILTLQDGSTIEVPVGDLISGLQPTIDSDHKLSADLVADGETNKVYTATEKQKLSGITEGAEPNVQSDWNQSNSEADDFIKNKPTIPDISGKADKVSGGTEDNFAALDANGNIKDSGHKHSDYLTQHQDISGKADKDTDAVEGHLAKFDANGNPVDGGDTADYAKNLVAPVVQSDAEFVYRKTCGTLAVDGKGGAAEIQKIKGRTLAWNQSVPNDKRNYTNTETDTRDYYDLILFALSAPSTPVGGFTHLYIYSAQIVSTVITTPSNCNYIVCKHNGASNDLIIYQVPSVPGHKYYFGQNVISANPTTVGGLVVNDNDLVDLTLLYGSAIDGMTDAEILAKFESEFPGYHDYNPGTLISNDAEAIETVGFNLWDEEWENGYWNVQNGNPITDATKIRTKNFIPIIGGSTYRAAYPNTGGDFNFVFYDIDKQYISGTYLNIDRYPTGGTFVAPAKAAYIKFYMGTAYGATYNHDICINLFDPAKNGTYEPYKKTVTQLNLNNIKVKSHNIWDEAVSTKAIDQSTGEQTGNDETCISSLNHIPVNPSTVYYVKCLYGSGSGNGIYIKQFDANKNPLSSGWDFQNVKNGTFTTSANARYIKFMTLGVYGTTYNHDICISLSSSFNGQYEPYGDITITGGLKSAGSVYDEIVGNKYIKRVGRCRIGDLDGYSESFYFVFSKEDAASTVYTNCVCSAYKTTDGIGEDKGICCRMGSNKGFVIKDSAYDTFNALKTAKANDYIDYALATPIEYELVTVPDYTYPVDGDGTERRLPEDTASSVHAPFRADILYALNGSTTLRNLDANYVRNDNIKQDTGNNENTVMSQAAVTRELGILSQRIAMTGLSVVDGKLCISYNV